MDVLAALKKEIVDSIQRVYGYDAKSTDITLSPTKKDFEGDQTFVVFPLIKELKAPPPAIAESLGEDLKSHSDLVRDYNVVKGFLNLSLDRNFWKRSMEQVINGKSIPKPGRGKKLMVEFSSPNTNKPLHLGHIRNILLGWSVSQIAEVLGYEVIKTQIINDRGIAICKSMLAWGKLGENKAPSEVGKKGDHFVGQFYVEFENMFREEYKAWQQTPAADEIYKKESGTGEDREHFFAKYKNRYFNEHSALGREAKQLLLKWEHGDPETRALWQRMNSWVYEGFAQTYKALGVDFDHLYYESDTYLLGKKNIERGLEEKIFYTKEDGSVWVDLEPEGMDHKILLRSDGTSVYMTQDIGTARKRFDDHQMDGMIYVVADEQDYHFKALFAILNKLGEPYADGLHHLSYGMVDLPTGKMKSREGTVVDADDLVDEVIAEARKSAEERGGLEGLSEDEKNEIYRKIGLAALKYFIIKVNPRKRMTFDPQESVDMQGTTGPYIQNAYVRIRSILRKSGLGEGEHQVLHPEEELNEFEKELVTLMTSYPSVIGEAMEKLDPSVIANFAYALAKTYHRFYHECRILNLEDKSLKYFRLTLSRAVAETLKNSMHLLGIAMPEYM